jgi:hypothetical protein
MRVISKFKDYYDGVMKTGMDREVVYVRENKEIELEESYGVDFSTQNSPRYSNIELVILGYCGKIYKIYTVTTSLNTEKEKHVFHDFESFRKFMMRYQIASKWDFEKRRYYPSDYQKFEALDGSRLIELFHKYQTPLFIVSHIHRYRTKSKTTLTLGPCLKDLEFYQIKDTYAAYQDIFQYVAGTLNRPENKMVEISDEDKVSKHGFDKWSFRKLPTKKKDKK